MLLYNRILIFQHTTLALFDLGSTFYYVSIYFAFKLGLIFKPVEVPLRASASVGHFFSSGSDM